MIKYKAAWKGIPVLQFKEYKTSITCNKCKEKGERPYQGLFKCTNVDCGYQANADWNAVQNILERAWEYISHAGVSVDMPVTEPFLVSSEAPSDREV